MPPKVDSNTLSDIAFQAYLPEAELVTVDEAYRAMLILADGQDGRQSFDERCAALESRGIARSAWNLQGDHVVDAGTVAFMVCQVCRLQGGVNYTLLGRVGVGDRRYALRELEFREMIDDSVDYAYMTGPAFYGVLRKADAYMEEKGLYESSGIDLSDEMDRDAEGNLIVPPSPKVPGRN